MSVSRRSALKAFAAAGGTIATSAVPLRADNEPRSVPADAVGMLYDATRCIGCKACVTACHEANQDLPDTRTPGMELYDAPTELNSRTRNIIKLHRSEYIDSYVKRQCMHCVDPACVGACMLGALQKRDFGIVTWDAPYCIGCRYCQVVCPFNVPAFEWESANPRIVKCELCVHRLREGLEPACCEVCPREAVIFGQYEDLLAEAHSRIVDRPDVYVDRVYGEHEVGGTQVLYLSHVPFEDLGFTRDSTEAVPSLQQSIQHGIYQGFVAPAALYALLGVVMFKNKRTNRVADSEADDE